MVTVASTVRGSVDGQHSDTVAGSLDEQHRAVQSVRQSFTFDLTLEKLKTLTPGKPVNKVNCCADAD